MLYSGGISSALTVYDAEGDPIAWAGRTSSLTPAQLVGADAWFVARVPLGLRLVHTRAVDATGRRVGVIAAERLLPSEGGLGDGRDPFLFSTRFGPVMLEVPGVAGTDPSNGSTFEVTAPSGQRLLTARILPDDLSRTRERWRRATRSLALVALALTVVLLAGPVLDWRNRARE